MKINKENLVHGAVLQQIVEADPYTAINALKIKGKKVACAYQVNEVGVFCRYSSERRGTGEYVFQFEKPALEAIFSSEARQKTFVVLVCLEDLEICLIDSVLLQEMLDQREIVGRSTGEGLTVLVKIERSFKVYVSSGKKGRPLAEKRVYKNAFPRQLFV